MFRWISIWRILWNVFCSVIMWYIQRKRREWERKRFEKEKMDTVVTILGCGRKSFARMNKMRMKSIWFPYIVVKLQRVCDLWGNLLQSNARKRTQTTSFIDKESKEICQFSELVRVRVCVESPWYGANERMKKNYQNKNSKPSRAYCCKVGPDDTTTVQLVWGKQWIPFGWLYLWTRIHHQLSFAVPSTEPMVTTRAHTQKTIFSLKEKKSRQDEKHWPMNEKVGDHGDEWNWFCPLFSSFWVNVCMRGCQKQILFK